MTPSLAGRELRFVAWCALAIVVVTSVPYALGHLLDFRHWRFNGNLVFDPDFNVYFGFVRQAAAGQWLFHDPFTPEPHRAVFFNLEWLAVGKLAAVSGVSLELAMQLERAAGILVLCVALYWLTSFVFVTVRARRLVWTMAMLGGGFGWLLAVPGLGPRLPPERFLDTYAGFHPFFWMLLQPHFLIAQAFAIVALSLFLRAESSGARRDHVLAAACCTLVGAMRPFEMAYLVVAIILYNLVSLRAPADARARPPILFRLLPALVPAPLMVYYLWLFKMHPVFRWWGRQNVLPPPEPSSLVATLGISAVLVVLALDTLGDLGRKPAARRLIVCCFLSSVALIYSYPVLTFTLQFGTTLVIPTVLVGTIKLESAVVTATARSKWARMAVAGLLVVNSLTSAWLLRSHLAAVAAGAARTDGRLLAAYRWLDEHTAPRDVVLSSCVLGNQLPRYTRIAAFCGHPVVTVDFRGKQALVKQFFSAKASEPSRRDMLTRFAVRYVLVSPYDGNVGRDEPPGSGLLERVFQNEVATVYRVVPSG